MFELKLVYREEIRFLKQLFLPITSRRHHYVSDSYDTHFEKGV